MLLIPAPGGRFARRSLAPAHHLAGIHYSVMRMENREGHLATKPGLPGEAVMGEPERQISGKGQGQLTLILGERVPDGWY